MKKEILTDAIELITKDCKDNVNKTKNYDEYLNAMTEKELDNIITLYSSMQYDEEELDLMYGILKENSKDFIKELEQDSRIRNRSFHGSFNK